MVLTVSFNQKLYDLDVPDKLIEDAQALYSKINRDMDQGWQISREWVEKPNTLQRCQVIADKILSAFHNENETMVLLMAGYIIYHLPEVKQITIDTTGDISQTTFS